MAVTLDGTLVASVGLYDGIHDAEAAVQAAVDHGGRVFVGVALRPHEVAHVKEWLYDTSYECLAFVLGARPRGQRRKQKRPAP